MLAFLLLMRHLLGDKVYTTQIKREVVDFKRTVIDHLFTIDKEKKDSFIYPPGLTQPDVYDILFQVRSHSFPEPQGFLSFPYAWKSNNDMKCRVDVDMLHNLLIYFQSILSQ